MPAGMQGDSHVMCQLSCSKLPAEAAACSCLLLGGAASTGLFTCSRQINPAALSPNTALDTWLPGETASSTAATVQSA